MNSNGGKQEPADPESALRRLELELIQQRMVRQHSGTPYRGLRAASFIFLFVVILAALLAFYYVFFMGGLDAVRARNSSQPDPNPPTTSGTP